MSSSRDPQQLRTVAEQQLADTGRPLEPNLPAADVQRIVHELQVHQIELELQNEELLAARIQLEEVSRRHIDLYDYAPSGYLTVDLDLAITRTNRAATRALGCDPTKLLGSNLLFHVTAAERAGFRAWLDRAIAGEHVQPRTVTFDPDTMTPLIASVTASVSPDRSECRVEFVDITQQVIDQRELQAAVLREQKLEIEATERQSMLSQLEQLLELAPDATITVNEAGVVERANMQAAILFGYTRDEIVGKPVEQLVPVRLQEVHQRHRIEYARNPINRGMATERDLHALRKDGSEVPVEISLSPLTTAQGVLTTVSIRDVTDKREKALARQRVLEAKQDLAESRSHEYQRALHHYRMLIRHRIANPLQVVEGMASTLLHMPDVDRSTRDNMLMAIVSAAEALKQEALFDPDQRDAVEGELHPRPFDDGDRAGLGVSPDDQGAGARDGG